jgi:predicted amidohydrolase YtcJ
MKQKARIPLLKDHHSHPYLYAALASCPDIRFVEEKERALEIIACHCVNDEVNVVIGWNDSLYGFSPAELDPLPPLIVMNASLHSFAMNRGAEAELAPRFPEITAHLDDREWLERNAPLIMEFVMGIRPCDTGRMSAFYDSLAEQGVWHAEEMTLWDGREIEMFDRSSFSGRSRFWATLAAFMGLDDEAIARVHGIKLFADGALGARTAKLSRCYLGGEEGFLIYDDEELHTLLSWCADAGKAVSVHAIGDLAIGQVVETVARLAERGPETRIEHCQFIDPQTADRAKSLGIILSMQPNFSLESDSYRDRLPEEFLAMNNPFRMLIDEAGFVPGKDLLFGSDGMPHGARYALQSALFPPYPGQRLTLSEFIAGYCMPDFENGFIDVAIDDEERSVTAIVTLKADE